jgi:biopolymer transport protein ExbD
MEFERRERFARHIDLTALVDIVFHLMIFFMITTSFVISESMELSLPQANSTTPAPLTQNVDETRIIVTTGGRLLLNGSPIIAEDAQAHLITTLGTSPDARIVILSTPGVLVQELVTVLDIVYFAGARNVQVDKGVI